MPLRVSIHINDDLLETVWIGRVEPLKGEDGFHQYVAGFEVGGEPPWRVGDAPLAVFYHTYSDGAVECVRLALDAMRGIGGGSDD